MNNSIQWEFLGNFGATPDCWGNWGFGVGFGRLGGQKAFPQIAAPHPEGAPKSARGELQGGGWGGGGGKTCRKAKPREHGALGAMAKCTTASQPQSLAIP